MAYAKELELKPCPICGGHVQYCWGPEGEVHGLFCQGCRMYVRWSGEEMQLKNREPIGAQMLRWAYKWNRRTT